MELIRDLRWNGHLIVARVVTLTLVALALYSYGTFVQSTEAAVDRSLSRSADVDVYTVIDRFTGDPEGFERFRASPEQVARLAAFVDELGHQAGIASISAFDQPVSVADGRSARETEAVQMNETAFDFAGLTVGTGRAPDWQHVDYDGATVPVVLGAAYEGARQVGDRFTGSFLFREFTFEVVGILAPDSVMYFRGDVNHFLDDAIVLPYPPELAGLAARDPGFAGILAFQVLNADLAVDRSLRTEDVLARLDRIGERTGFTDYSLTGVPTYVVQLAQVRQLVADNLGLLTGLIVLLVLAAAVVVLVLAGQLARRRDVVRAAYASTGHGAGRLARLFVPSWLLEHALVLAVIAIVCTNAPNQHAVPFLAVVLGLLAVAALDGLALRRDPLAGPVVRKRSLP